MDESQESKSDAGYSDETKAFDALNVIIKTLSGLQSSDRHRVLSTVLTFFGVAHPSPVHMGNGVRASSPSGTVAGASTRSGHAPTPKQFLGEKQPKTDVERVACLAYYLANYRETPHFKTIEITNLNTEAAWPRFSNPAKATGNALDYGYLVQANKGNRQLSAAGESFVQALPDREAAKAAMLNAKPKRTKSSAKRKDDATEASEETQ